MQDKEELPLAIAFSDSRFGEICQELVFDQDLFWGTIHTNLQNTLSTAFLTQRNNFRLERALWLSIFLPASLRDLICHYLHHHF